MRLGPALPGVMITKMQTVLVCAAGLCGLASVFLGASGCDNCEGEEAPACEDGVFIKFTAPFDELPGDYEVLVVHDGTEEMCTFTLEIGDLQLGDCNLGVLTSIVPVTLDGEDVYIGGTPEGLGYVSMYLSGLPESVSVELRRDGEVLAEGEFEPAYEGFKTNATRCHSSDGCDVAVEEFSIADESGSGTESG